MKLILKIYSFNLSEIKKNITNIKLEHKNLIFKEICLPINKKKIIVNTSPHVNNKSKEQFEQKTFSSVLIIKTEMSILHLNKLIKSFYKIFTSTVSVEIETVR